MGEIINVGELVQQEIQGGLSTVRKDVLDTVLLQLRLSLASAKREARLNVVEELFTSTQARLEKAEAEVKAKKGIHKTLAEKKLEAIVDEAAEILATVGLDKAETKRLLSSQVQPKPVEKPAEVNGKRLEQLATPR